MIKKTKSIIPDEVSWDLLKRFDVVANSLNFSDAANKIGTSQGALVTQMTKLEKDVKFEIFNRAAKKRSLELTEDGKNLLKKIQIMKGGLFGDITEKDIEEQKKQEELDLIQPTNIKLITTPGLATTIFPDLIIEFMKNDKNVNFLIETPIGPIKVNENEVIVRHNFLKQKNLKTIKLIDLPFSFYASKEYLAENPEPLNWDDLYRHKFLSFNVYFDQLNKISTTDRLNLNRDAFVTMKPIVETSSIFILIELALKNMGIIELPNSHPVTKHLKRINFFKTSYTTIYASYLNINSQSDAFLKFVEHLTLGFQKKFLNNSLLD